MNKINKKNILDIEQLSKVMEKNNLSELTFSEGETLYKLKKKENQSTINSIEVIKFSFASVLRSPIGI